ncbi:hypothetical protein NJD71_13875, partial [Psychrobacter sp. PP-21]|uniref:hypothetical protein n=1 Tax=Psychrobacter sp. PP-21 TaxID=2957503 RepID=UPI0029ABC245
NSIDSFLLSSSERADLLPNAIISCCVSVGDLYALKRVTSEFKQAMKERDTINVVDELAAIKIDEKYYEQANRAITSSKQ